MFPRVRRRKRPHVFSIRSYTFNTFSLIKDHRTGVEVGNVQGVMDGDLDPFISAYLQQQAAQ